MIFKAENLKIELVDININFKTPITGYNSLLDKKLRSHIALHASIATISDDL